MVSRVQKFKNLIFRTCEGQSQPHSLPWNSTPC